MISVDIVLTSYNSGEFLSDALDSVASQTLPARRVIVVDDGSSDGSVARTIAGRANITVIRQQNAGASAARNTGMAASRADAALIFDHDDLLSLNAIEVLVAAMDTGHHVDMVHGSVREFVDDRVPLPPGVRAVERVLPSRLSGSTLIRRSLWDQVGGFVPSMRKGEWIDWIDRSSTHGANVVVIDDVILHRRIHGRNMTADAGSKSQYLAVARAALLRKREGPSS